MQLIRRRTIVGLSYWPLTSLAILVLLASPWGGLDRDMLGPVALVLILSNIPALLLMSYLQGGNRCSECEAPFFGYRVWLVKFVLPEQCLTCGAYLIDSLATPEKTEEKSNSGSVDNAASTEAFSRPTAPSPYTRSVWREYEFRVFMSFACVISPLFLLSAYVLFGVGMDYFWWVCIPNIAVCAYLLFWIRAVQCPNCGFRVTHMRLGGPQLRLKKACPKCGNSWETPGAGRPLNSIFR